MRLPKHAQHGQSQNLFKLFKARHGHHLFNFDQDGEGRLMLASPPAKSDG